MHKSKLYRSDDKRAVAYAKKLRYSRSNWHRRLAYAKYAIAWSDFKSSKVIPHLLKQNRLPKSAKYAKCTKCQRKFPVQKLDVDHIVRKSFDYSKEYDLTNLQFLCRQCHKEKTSLDFKRNFDNEAWLKGEPNPYKSRALEYLGIATACLITIGIFALMFYASWWAMDKMNDTETQENSGLTESYLGSQNRNEDIHIKNFITQIL